MVHETLDDRDSLNFVRETSFIFDLRATRGIHIIAVDIILFRPYTRSVITCHYIYRTARFKQSCTVGYIHTVWYKLCAYHGTSIQYLYTEHKSSIHTL